MSYDQLWDASPERIIIVWMTFNTSIVSVLLEFGYF